MAKTEEQLQRLVAPLTPSVPRPMFFIVLSVTSEKLGMVESC